MKHIKLYESFNSDGEDLIFENWSGSKFKALEDYVKKNPEAKAASKRCETLYKAMEGTGTDESAIYGVFSKLKTKAELVQLIAIWDILDVNYIEAAGSGLGGILDFFTGRDDAFSKQASNKWNLYSSVMKDTLSKLAFWNKPGTPNVDAYIKHRDAFYKKHPDMKSTKLSFWLKEELNGEEIAKLNKIIKKFGIQF